MFNISKTPINRCLTGKIPKPLSLVIIIVSFLQVIYPLKNPSTIRIYICTLKNQLDSIQNCLAMYTQYTLPLNQICDVIDYVCKHGHGMKTLKP